MFVTNSIKYVAVLRIFFFLIQDCSQDEGLVVKRLLPWQQFLIKS